MYRRIIQLILLALLGLITSLSVPVLSAQQIPETAEIIPLVQHSSNNQSVKKSQKAYRTSFLPSCLLFPSLEGLGMVSASCLLALDSVGKQALNSNARSLLQQGINFYEAQQYSAAVEIWLQAAAVFATEEDNLSLALVQSNLSLAYQHLGYWQEAQKAIAKSLDLLKNQPNSANTQTYLEIYAKALNTKGRWQWTKGELEEALATWKQAAANYAQADNQKGVITSLINQAKALQGLGVNSQAKKTLYQVAQVLETSSDSQLQAIGLRNLGKAYREVGSLKKSQQFLAASLAVAEKFALPKAKISAWLELGNTEQALGKLAIAIGNQKEAQDYYQTALSHYQQAATTSDSPLLQLQAQLNQLSLFVETGKSLNTAPLLPEIKNAIAFLPPSRTTIYAQLNFARSLTCIRSLQDGMKRRQNNEGIFPSASCLLPSASQGERLIEVPSWQEIAQILVTAVQQSKSLQDHRAQSYALGQLGSLYELTGQLSEAQKLTQQALKALILSQELQSPDIRYLWEWQLGRLFKQQGDTQSALEHYTKAIKTLTSVRYDLITINDMQFSFRENVEPIYRQLVDLLLQSEPKETELAQAREVIEELQLAELEDYLRCSLLNNKAITIDKLVNQSNATAAVIYPIILDGRLEIILKLPQQPLRHYQTSLSQQEFDHTIAQLRENLKLIHTLKQVQSLSQQLYNWLIQPIESTLNQSKIQTLVFVLDGDLRNVPMSILYDGQQYLLEKYSVALTTGLELLDPKPLERKSLRVLTAGLTEARHGYSSLEYVDDELEQIESQVSGELLIRACCISVEAMPDKNFKHFYPEKVQGNCIDGFNFLALSWEIPE
ncbi:MAG: CHAT domain-containing protein [Symploca sp. SIO2C1]|nr:CHAT domain-containing protein [Symploca sp. SIO2C1]